MAITRRRFNAIARAFGLTPVNPSSRVPRYFIPTMHSRLPQCGVADWVRAVAANDLFLAFTNEADTVFTMGHEAGHVVYNHSRYRRRHTAHEIQADMWGILALEAHGLPLDAGLAMHRTMMTAYPGTDIRGEMTARIRAMETVLALPREMLHDAIVAVCEVAAQVYPVTEIVPTPLDRLPPGLKVTP